jgi:alkylation response protein AidB-like acyl-CoA dehydrogenase
LTTQQDLGQDSVLLYHQPFSEEELAYAQTIRAFLRREVEPRYNEIGTDSASRHDLWKRAGAAGILGVTVPERFGGAGGGPLLSVVLSYELARSVTYATLGSWLTTDLATGLLIAGGSDELIAKWAPLIMAGEVIQSTGISEADAGSDVLAIRTTARRDGDEYVLNGGKIFITNGDIADICYVVAKTGKEAGSRGLSLFLVDLRSGGVTRRKLKTMGFPGSNTAELAFDNVRVPAGNLLGTEGGAMKQLMVSLAEDRIQVGARALGQAELAFELTVEYARQRHAFGQAIFDYQNTQFQLASMKTEIEVGRAFLHEQVRKARSGLATPAECAMCKLFLSEASSRVVDGCVQLFGGMGFMDETPISRIYTGNRALRIYAGTSEILRRSIARSL